MQRITELCKSQICDMTLLLMNIGIILCVTAKSTVRNKTVYINPLCPYLQKAFIPSVSVVFQRNYPLVNFYQQFRIRFYNFSRWKKLHPPAMVNARG